MPGILRAFRWIVAMAVAGATTIVPACGTMGGGGMHYFTDAPLAASDSA